MFASLCKRLCPNLNFVGYSYTHLGIVRYNHVRSLYYVKHYSSSSRLPQKKFISQEEEEHSFTVSYLVNSCGLSLENAISVSNKVHFETPKKPDSVLALLKNHGFTNTHISKIVMNFPELLLSNPKNTLLPKLEFFQSIGVPSSEIVRILSYDPKLFKRSIKNQIIPSYNFLKSLVGTDEKVVIAFRRSSQIFKEKLSKNFVPNMAILKELGVPHSSILLLVTQYPPTAFSLHKRFKETVEYLKGMGFDPRKSVFVQAIKVISGIGKAGLEQKIEFYNGYGWSKDEAISAFKYQPHCMILSEKRIMKAMDFYVNQMGWPSKLIARHPIILCFSVEKRIIPRCSVFQALLSKGVVKNNFSMYFLQPNEKLFLRRFVTRFQKKVPQLMDLYEGKMDLEKLLIGPGEKCENEALVTYDP